MHYATLYQVRQYLKFDADNVNDDTLLASLIDSTVTAVDDYTRRRFDSYHATRSFDYPGKPFDPFGVYHLPVAAAFVTRTRRELKLDESLLVLHTLTNGNGDDIPVSDVLLYPSNRYPKHKLKLKVSSDSSWAYASNGDTEQVIDAEGKWGFHKRYAESWVDSLDTVQDDPLAIGGTALTVSDADGQAGDAEAVRFQVGNMIRFGSAEIGEYAFIRAVNTTTNVLTIVRGYNGTTAEEQDNGTGIYVYRPMRNVVFAAIRVVVWRYRQKDVDSFDKRYILGTGFAIEPSAMPADVISLLPTPRETIRH